MLRDLFSLFPACAGVIPTNTDTDGFAYTFPRMCGGDPQRYTTFRNQLKLFPACAGVIPESAFPRQMWSAFPRMCGGDPGAAAGLATATRFSPHVRG